MKYTEKDFTQWHDGKTKPVHVGVYQKGKFFSYWTGKIWNPLGGTVADAYLLRLAYPEFQSCSSHNPWRGLRVKPNE